MQDRWKEAEELHVQVIDARKRVLGPDHRDTLTSRAGLAANLARQKRWDEAEEIFAQLMAVYVKGFGAEHPEQLKIL
jgi:pentatricopeptide repeat protein